MGDEISTELREELERRLTAYSADPASARPWEEIREELFGGTDATSPDRRRLDG